MKKSYKLIDLDCAVCAQKIQDAVAKLDEVSDVQVSYIMQKMTLETKDGSDINALMKKISKIIKKIEPDCEIVL